ncbi:MAG: serine/threonine protein kinase [Planctomycetaceae bacterium]|nr:serine/threonine protein kinase [Planctomycetaceae bacterium]
MDPSGAASLPANPTLPAIASGAEPVAGYRLVERLGRGAFGEVWKAGGPGGFQVALKFVLLSGQTGPIEQRALGIIRDIRHPHLLAMFGAWQVDDYLVLAMELAERTLMDRLHEAVAQGHTGIPVPEAVEDLMDAAQGIDYLNESRHPSPEGEGRVGIQHRDIKPQNLLLVGGSVKVADFGLARILRGSQTSHTGSLTPSYAAPEFFQNQTSRHSDQYSLGITYCHLRGGRLPFTGSFAQVMAGHLMRPPDLSMLPPKERDVVARALSKDPDARWSSCRAFAEELQARVSDRERTVVPPTMIPGEAPEEEILATSDATTVVPRHARGVGWLGRWQVLAAGAAVVLVLVGAITWALGRRLGAEIEPFRLELPSTLTLRAGERTRIPIRLVRRGWDGAVGLAFEGNPEGVAIAGRSIPAGSDEAVIEVEAAPTASASRGEILVVGTGGGRTAAGKLSLTIEPTGAVEVRCLDGRAEPVACLALAPGGRLALIGPVEGPVQLWDVLGGREPSRLPGPAGRVACLAVAPDGRRALAGIGDDPFHASDGSLRAWDLETEAEPRNLNGHPRRVSAVAIFPDGRRALSSGDDASVRVWDLDSGQELRTLRGPETVVTCLAVAPDARHALAGGADGSVDFWDLDRGEVVRRLVGPRGEVLAVAFSADGTRAYSASVGAPFRVPDETLRAWDVATGAERRRLAIPETVACLAFAPDGRLALIGCTDGTVRLWDVAAGRERARLSGHDGRVACVAFAPDGHLALSGGDDGTVRLWSLEP